MKRCRRCRDRYPEHRDECPRCRVPLKPITKPAPNPPAPEIPEWLRKR